MRFIHCCTVLLGFNKCLMSIITTANNFSALNIHCTSLFILRSNMWASVPKEMPSGPYTSSLKLSHHCWVKSSNFPFWTAPQALKWMERDTLLVSCLGLRSCPEDHPMCTVLDAKVAGQYLWETMHPYMTGGPRCWESNGPLLPYRHRELWCDHSLWSWVFVSLHKTGKRRWFYLNTHHILRNESVALCSAACQAALLLSFMPALPTAAPAALRWMHNRKGTGGSRTLCIQRLS